MLRTRTALTTTTIAAAPGFWIARHALSPAVRTWTRPSLAPDTTGPLFARVGGGGDQAVVLLHGLVSSGDVFGAAYDELAATRRLVVPDLLGFGRSMDTTRQSFSIDDHLNALDQLADRTGLFEQRWTIGAHSMSSALALRWAARHAQRVDRVVCWGAPIYASPGAALAKISGSAMARLFVLDTRWAEAACA
ncbi:MAG: alpha/beta fold hydrolase, partial [Ilumatobacteraceae bacterium]